MKVVWGRAKSLANRKKHGVSFEEARELLVSDVDHLEIFDEEHSELEDRFISIGPIRRGLVLVVWTERESMSYGSSARGGLLRMNIPSTVRTSGS